jgi:cysteinyl-tRNA synthetase
VGNIHEEYRNKFKEFVGDDLDTPRALSLVWDVLKDPNMSNKDKKATLLDFDKVLGLGLDSLKVEDTPAEVMKIAEEREEARKNKDFTRSDELRKKINELGYEVKDTSTGQKIYKL